MHDLAGFGCSDRSEYGVVALTGHQCVDAVRAVVGRTYGLVPVAVADEVDDLSKRGWGSVRCAGGDRECDSGQGAIEPFMKECG